MSKKVSDHITLAEATKSQTATRKGIDNTPIPTHLAKMRVLAEKVFEPIRKWVGGPIAVTSFYRSPELNKAIGGSSTSQHCLGEAMDIDADVFNSGEKSNADIFEWVKENLEFDQMIWEFGDDDNPNWVHISYREGNNRNRCLRAKRNSNGKTYYEVI